jgi:hypothetical protein
VAGGTSTGFPNVPEFLNPEAEHRRQIARALNSTRSGKLNATLAVTLRSNQATTTVTDARIGVGSWIGFMGTNASGAGQIARGIYVTSRISGSCVLNHQNSPEANQNITLLIIG